MKHSIVGVAANGSGVRKSPSLRGVQVLLVEDTALTAQAAALLLERLGAEVTIAATRKEGLVLLDTRIWDLAIVDPGLPDGDGGDIVREALSKDFPPQVLVVSGSIDRLNATRFQVLGCIVVEKTGLAECLPVAALGALERRRDRARAQANTIAGGASEARARPELVTQFMAKHHLTGRLGAVFELAVLHSMTDNRSLHPLVSASPASKRTFAASARESDAVVRGKKCGKRSWRSALGQVDDPEASLASMFPDRFAPQSW